MADVTPGNTPSSNRNVMILLSYLWLLALVPLLTEKDDKEVQWHAKNGLALAIAWVVVLIVWEVLSFVMARVFGPLACLGSVVGCVLGIGFLVVDVMAMVKAINGQRMRIPVVTDLAAKM